MSAWQPSWPKPNPKRRRVFRDLGDDPVPSREPIETAEVVEVFEREEAPGPEQSVDTAALLRELASLGGFGDGASDAPSTVSSPVTKSSPVSKDSDKKRRRASSAGSTNRAGTRPHAPPEVGERAMTNVAPRCLATRPRLEDSERDAEGGNAS